MSISPAHSVHAPAPAANGPILRSLMALPVLGHMLRDLGRDVNMVFYYLVIALTALVFAMQVWGLAALAMAALALVPAMFALIIWITLP